MLNEKLLAALVAALAINEFIHVMFEIWGIRQKVAWLRARMDKKPHGEWPLNIDTLAKTLLLHGAMFIILTGLFYGILVYLNVTVLNLLYISVLCLVVTYSLTVFGMDAFHGEIGQLLRRYKKIK